MRRKIRKLLAALGEDPAAVLRDLGLGGWSGDATDCPVARYLEAHGVPITYVSCRRIEWKGMGIAPLHINEEFPAVKDFIRQFDCGRITL